MSHYQIMIWDCLKCLLIFCKYSTESGLLLTFVVQMWTFAAALTWTQQIKENQEQNQKGQAEAQLVQALKVHQSGIKQELAWTRSPENVQVRLSNTGSCESLNTSQETTRVTKDIRGSWVSLSELLNASQHRNHQLNITGNCPTTAATTFNKSANTHDKTQLHTTTSKNKQ